MADSSTISVRMIPTKQFVAPTTGSTVNVNTNGNVCLFINPVGTLLSLTVALPASPQDMDVLEIHSSQIITGLSISGGTIIGALTSMAVGTFAKYRYYSDTSSWARVG